MRHLNRVRSQNSTPRAIFFGIISPLYAEMVFMTIGVVGFSLLVLGGSMHQEEEESKQQR
jgi:uncharacterized membrane protein YccC